MLIFLDFPTGFLVVFFVDILSLPIYIRFVFSIARKIMKLIKNLQTKI